MDSDDLIPISPVRTIFEMIDSARQLQKCAAIIGVPGVGKTWALSGYREQNETSTHMVTVTGVTGNALRDLLRKLCDVLGIWASGSIADIQNRMLAYDLSGYVLILDEAQNLKLQAYREVLYLHDKAGLVIVFCGNNEVLKRVNTNTGAFAQISRRVPLRCEITGILDADADLLCDAQGVEGDDARRLTREIAREHHTDGVVTVLTIARRHAGEHKAIRAQHIREAVELFPQYRAALSLKPVRSGVA